MSDFIRIRESSAKSKCDTDGAFANPDTFYATNLLSMSQKT
jgi:hypothetical protein